MDPPRAGPLCLLAALLACGAGPEPVTLETGIGNAIEALPWDAHGLAPALCPTLAPCDTVILEPRIARLPHPAPVFYNPQARPVLSTLQGDPLTAVPGLRALHRPVRYGAWTECLARRHDPGWETYRIACVAIGVAGAPPPTDTLQFALLVLSPNSGLSWPRVRLTAGTGGWKTELVSMGGE